MKKKLSLYFFLFLLGFVACKKPKTDGKVITIQRTQISINSDSTVKYLLGDFGEEEGCSILQQAAHYDISSIDRTAGTAIYTYKPNAAYSGKDSVEIGEYRGSDGASPSVLTKKDILIFTVTH
ncbi:MAG TPA: hypothetical protein PLK15_00775 [Chitinophagales bacterium]|jgi:hypothetical protein|nr:hypothetical protein [Chitinophagales bacterium]